MLVAFGILPVRRRFDRRLGISSPYTLWLFGCLLGFYIFGGGSAFIGWAPDIFCNVGFHRAISFFRACLRARTHGNDIYVYVVNAKFYCRRFARDIDIQPFTDNFRAGVRDYVFA